jgi:hypothetical protein
LWLSHLGFFLTIIALLFQQPLFISIACVGLLPQELAWNIDFFYQLFVRSSLFGFADYMFNVKFPLFLRSLSLFHICLPIIWIWSIVHFGYWRKAALYATVLIWINLTLVYFFTNPADNINWVFMPLAYQWQFVSPFGWLMFLMIGIPVFIIAPMHLLLKRVAKKYIN